MTWKELALQPMTQMRKNLKEIKKNPKELMIHVVASMCDNKYILSLKKDSNGEFKMSGNGYSLSNFGFKSPVYEIEWAADEGDWSKVIHIINSGYQRIDKIVSR
tara:strand:+ start:3426 stop:3737 length:312 start_codon:yes stop_codon:yes gene_type:complete